MKLKKPLSYVKLVLLVQLKMSLCMSYSCPDFVKASITFSYPLIYKVKNHRSKNILSILLSYSIHKSHMQGVLTVRKFRPRCWSGRNKYQSWAKCSPPVYRSLPLGLIDVKETLWSILDPKPFLLMFAQKLITETTDSQFTSSCFSI